MRSAMVVSTGIAVSVADDGGGTLICSVAAAGLAGGRGRGGGVASGPAVFIGDVTLAATASAAAAAASAAGADSVAVTGRTGDGVSRGAAFGVACRAAWEGRATMLPPPLPSGSPPSPSPLSPSSPNSAARRSSFVIWRSALSSASASVASLVVEVLDRRPCE